MEEKFLIGTKLMGDTYVGFSLGKRIAIPIKNILEIEDGTSTSYCKDRIKKDETPTRILISIEKEKYLGTLIHYMDGLHESPQCVYIIENFDECIDQLKN